MIEPATDEDVARFYGGIAFGAQWTGRVLRRGRLVAGFGGLLEIEDGVWLAFLEVPSHERRPYLYRHILAAVDEIRAKGARVIKATCDESIPRSEALMRRLGFEPTDEMLGDRVMWICQV